MLLSGVAFVLWGFRPRGPASMSGPAARAPGFRDAATESGIDFRMSFLPDEQGENFRQTLASPAADRLHLVTEYAIPIDESAEGSQAKERFINACWTGPCGNLPNLPRIACNRA
jgi:hypothetical protein